MGNDINRPKDAVVMGLNQTYIEAPMPSLNDNCPECSTKILDGSSWRVDSESTTVERLHSGCLTRRRAAAQGNHTTSEGTTTVPQSDHPLVAKAVEASEAAAVISSPSPLERFVEADLKTQTVVIDGKLYVRIPDDPVDPFRMGTRVHINPIGSSHYRVGWVADLGRPGFAMVRIPDSGSVDSGSDPTALADAAISSQVLGTVSPNITSINTELTEREKSFLKADLKNRFTYHPPQPEQIEAYSRIRAQGKAFAYLLADLAPNSRERATALTKLEEVVMWSNAAIARSKK